MIALLFAARAFAQDPPPTEPVPAEPPVEEPPPPVEEAPPPVEPGWEPVTVNPTGEPTVEAEPTPEVDPAPWIAVPDEPRPTFLRYGVALEVGSLGNDDPAYDLFSDGNSMGSFGAAIGFNLLRHLAVVGSWHHFRHGATVSVGGTTESDADFESDAQEFRSAWLANEGSLGLRVDAGIKDVLFPYVAAQGLLMGARLRLDDDPDENDNPGQVQAGALTHGVMGTAGVEVRIPPDANVQAAWTLEFGYGWLARADFGAFGTMQPGGFVARSGLGLRF